MSIYNAIANVGSNAGAGISAYAQNRYAVQADQEQRAQNKYAMDIESRALREKERQAQFEEAALILAGGGTEDQAIGFLNAIEPVVDRDTVLAGLRGRAAAMGGQQSSETERLMSGLSPEEAQRARRIALGLEAKAEGPKAPGRPVKVMGDDGVARWVYPEDAVGAMAAPNSPAVTVVMPGADTQKPTGATLNQVQGNIVGAETTLRDLDAIADTYSDDFLTASGRALAAVGSFADKYLDADPAGLASFNAERSAFEGNVRQFFNQYRKEITGAAASAQELEQLLKAMFSQERGPREFKAMYNQFKSKVEANLRANARIAREGVRVDGVADVPQGNGAPQDGAINWSDLK